MATKIQIHEDKVTPVPLDMIDLDQDQPRTYFDETKLSHLADDIKARGVREPIKLRPGEDGRFILVKGERRYRASQLAKKKDIPALKEEDKADIDRLLNQVKENYLREDLNPMELAGFLARLRDVHKIKVSDMPAFLKKHAMPEMSRSYISNLIRLVDLPEWATELIQQGELSGAHGKYLLAAKASEAVMAGLEERVKNALKGFGKITTEELQELVEEEFSEHHIQLHRWSVPFDIETECKGCKTRKTIAAGYGAEQTYCLNKECFDQKKAKAKAAKKEQEKAGSGNTNLSTGLDALDKPEPFDAKADKDGVVDLDNQGEIAIYDEDFTILENRHIGGGMFDASSCKYCPHKKPAKGEDIDEMLDIGEEEEPKTGQVVECCFNIACFEDKLKQQKAAQRRERDLRDYLSAWCRKRIIGYHLQDDTSLQLNIVAFMALDYPLMRNDYLESDRAWNGRDNDNVEELVGELNLTSLARCFERGVTSHLAAIAAAGIRETGTDSILQLAHQIGLTLDDYQIDQDFLALHNKEELIQMGEAANLPELFSPGSWDTACKGGMDDLYPFFLSEEAAKQFGVPQQLKDLLAKG